MRLFDITIVALVLLPWLTDGLTLQLSDFLSLAPSDLGIPILAVAVVTHMVSLASRLARRRITLSGAVAQEMPPLIGMGAALAALVMVLVLWRLWASNASIDLSSVLWTLTHGSGAIPAIAAAAAMAGRYSGESWDRSIAFRIGRGLALAWRAAIASFPSRTLWFTAGMVGASLLWISILRHRAFETHGYDLGIFTNAMWNLTHGNGYFSSVKGGINLFSDHQSPLFWLIAPVFWMVPRPETLLVVQAFGLAAGGPALYYLARKRFGAAHWAPAALPWLYWAYLPIRNANAFDFHPEVFMLPLFLWAFVGFASHARWAKALGAGALLGALAAKESAGVVAAGIGFAMVLTGGKRPWRERCSGIALAAAGSAVFIFDVNVVPRIFGGEHYAYLGLYARFGGSLVDVLLAPIVQPTMFFSQLIDPARVNFLIWTLAPIGFLPLFEWRAALAALPPYVMLFLSEGDQRVRIVFHYGIEPASALFWALPLGLAAFARRFGWKSAGLWMVFWALACLGPSELMRARSYSQTERTRWLNTAMPCVDPEAPTAASDVLVPHLSTRAWISYPDQLEQRPSTAPISCVVTDLRVSNWPLGRGGVERVLAGLPKRGYHEVYRCGAFSVFGRDGTQCMRCAPRCAESGSEGVARGEDGTR